MMGLLSNLHHFSCYMNSQTACYIALGDMFIIHISLLQSARTYLEKHLDGLTDCKYLYSYMILLC